MAAKPHATQQQIHLAVLIDADNAPAAIVEGLFEEIAKYGVASVKRIYGDWTKPNLGSWKKVLLDYSIQPIQQFAYTSGKNATDSSLIIDAMDLLYTRRFDGFCLVSSDSDFTRLAARIREEGLTVYGFGEQKTPSPFVCACDKFIYTEILRADAPKTAQEPPGNGDKPPQPPTPEKTEEETRAAEKSGQVKAQKVPADFIAKVLDDISDEDGWISLAALGSTIGKLRPAFDPRLYGFRKLSELIGGQPSLFELQVRGSTATGGKVLYARNRKSSRQPT